MRQKYLEAGKVTRTHGIHGEVVVQPWADSPEFLCRFKTLYVDESHWPIRVERARVSKQSVILKLEGVTDVNSALAMRNAILHIDRDDVELPPDSFFIADLIGLEALDAESGEVLGTLSEVLTPPANDVYVIRKGEHDMLVPAVPEFIAETNIDGGYIRIHRLDEVECET